jgi:lysophospholipase L1-like esterase
MALRGPFGSADPAPADKCADASTYLASVVSELEKCWPSNRTVTLVFHGHSVPAGYFKTPAVDSMDAYPNLLRRALANRFPHAVINVIVTAIGGETSLQGAARFDADVLALKPDVVFIDYALNDRGAGLEKARTAWAGMIQKSLAAGARVILLTPTADTSARLDHPDDPLNQHAEQIRRLAAEFHVGLADSLALFKAELGRGTPLAHLMAQANHPNAAGHKLVADEILKWFPPPPRPVTVVSYYFGNYHPGDPRNVKTKGPNWSEWELVRNAKPHFPGHQQPHVPLWGYQDESDPGVMAGKIAAAADHGISAFIFDWYYYDDGPFLDSPIDNGFLKAANNARLKFAFMWANHDWTELHPYHRGDPRQVLYPGRVKPENFTIICDHLIRDYFSHPSYWRIEGKPYFSFYDLEKLLSNFGSVAATRSALDSFRARAVAAGLPGLHLNEACSGRLMPNKSSSSAGY